MTSKTVSRGALIANSNGPSGRTRRPTPVSTVAAPVTASRNASPPAATAPNVNPTTRSTPPVLADAESDGWFEAEAFVERQPSRSQQDQGDEAADVGEVQLGARHRLGRQDPEVLLDVDERTGELDDEQRRHDTRRQPQDEGDPAHELEDRDGGSGDAGCGNAP